MPVTKLYILQLSDVGEYRFIPIDTNEERFNTYLNLFNEIKGDKEGNGVELTRKRRHKKEEVNLLDFGDTPAFDPIKTWKKFATKKEMLISSKLLQIMGSVARAMVILNKDKERENRERINIDQRINLYKHLDKNSRLVKYLNKKFYDEGYKYRMTEEDKSKINKYKDIDNLNIEELNERMEAINQYSKTVEQPVIMKRLMKIYNKCAERKNKLIKEEEEKQRDELIKEKGIKPEEMKEDALKLRTAHKQDQKGEMGNQAEKFYTKPRGLKSQKKGEKEKSQAGSHYYIRASCGSGSGRGICR